jgi:hypothetical protein
MRRLDPIPQLRSAGLFGIYSEFLLVQQDEILGSKLDLTSHLTRRRKENGSALLNNCQSNLFGAVSVYEHKLSIS